MNRIIQVRGPGFPIDLFISPWKAVVGDHVTVAEILRGGSSGVGSV